MKKLSFIVMACLMVLGLAQCKKNEPTNNNTADNGDRVNITLTLDNGGQRVHPEEENGLANVVYDNGDVVYVGSNGKYMGCLTYNGSVFTGGINAEAKEDAPLQFIFMGGQTIDGLVENSSTECVFNIGNQSNGLAVISCAPSNEDFSLTNLSYTATLRNKCALVKFDLGEMSTDAAITLTGLKTEATIGFNGTVTNGTTTGNIVTYGTGSTRYAVVLSDQGAVTNGTISAEGYTGTFSIPTAAYTNAFLSTSLALYPIPTTITWDNTNVFNDSNEGVEVSKWESRSATFEDITITMVGSGVSQFVPYELNHMEQTIQSVLKVFGNQGDSFTFTAPSGKKFTKIVVNNNGFITFTAHGDWTRPVTTRIEWNGTAANVVTLGGSNYTNCSDLISIVFTLVDAN